jgi:hypothetical protein
MGPGSVGRFCRTKLSLSPCHELPTAHTATGQASARPSSGHSFRLLAAMSDQSGQARRYSPPSRIYVICHAKGITAADERYIADHPHETYGWRPYVSGELEVDPPDATDVSVFEDHYYDGTRTGHWNRTVVHRVERSRY